MACRKVFHAQVGTSLLEVLAGITIGLLLIAIALLAIQISHGMAHLTQETTAMHQDASTALRIMGQQIRQAGSVQLNTDVIDPRLRTALTPTHMLGGVAQGHTAISSPAVPRSDSDALQIRYRNAAAPLQGHAAVSGPQLKDCLGQNTSKGLHPEYISSTFFLRKKQLMCTGVTGLPQPVIDNVNDFAFRLLLAIPQSKRKSAHSLSYVSPEDIRTDADLWRYIIAVEICLELQGTPPQLPKWPIDYTNCQGQKQTTQGALMAVYRHSFHIRSPGASR